MNAGTKVAITALGSVLKSVKKLLLIVLFRQKKTRCLVERGGTKLLLFVLFLYLILLNL